VKVVPVLVGSLDKQNEELFGRVFAPYLDDPENFFVISSDFCHWGKRFVKPLTHTTLSPSLSVQR
jgi:predicted class III extradiol MEMO1 family dioxygenase